MTTSLDGIAGRDRSEAEVGPVHGVLDWAFISCDEASSETQPKGDWLAEESHCSPCGEEKTYQGQEHRPTGPESGILHTFGCLALTGPDPGQAIAHEESEPQAEHQLWQQILEVEEVGHGPDGNGG